MSLWKILRHHQAGADAWVPRVKMKTKSYLYIYPPSCNEMINLSLEISCKVRYKITYQISYEIRISLSNFIWHYTWNFIWNYFEGVKFYRPVVQNAFDLYHRFDKILSLIMQAIKSPNHAILYVLTHWGRVTHICVSKLTIIIPHNCLDLNQC